jgi:hypothetical protein
MSRSYIPPFPQVPSWRVVGHHFFINNNQYTETSKTVSSTMSVSQCDTEDTHQGRHCHGQGSNPTMLFQLFCP